jgi:nucleoside phosphorylase
MEDAAAQLTVAFGLPTRAVSTIPNPALVVSHITMSAEPDLVLFVALEEELAVLAKSLGLDKTASTPEATGKIDGIDVAVICPRAMGRVAAAVAMTSYLARRGTRPKLILIVGIAGGFPENKTVQGHIIVVDKVVDLAMRKVGDSAMGAEPNFRREEYPLLDQVAKQTLSDDFDTHGWSSRVAAELEWESDRRPSLHYGPIGSADEVVASDPWRAQFLGGKGGEPKLLGVEMEAGGVCAAARRFKIPVSMLRVVSDQADPAKTDDHWRKLGMKTLADLIANMSVAKIIAAID